MSAALNPIPQGDLCEYTVIIDGDYKKLRNTDNNIFHFSWKTPPGHQLMDCVHTAVMMYAGLIRTVDSIQRNASLYDRPDSPLYDGKRTSAQRIEENTKWTLEQIEQVTGIFKVTLIEYPEVWKKDCIFPSGPHVFRPPIPPPLTADENQSTLAPTEAKARAKK